MFDVDGFWNLNYQKRVINAAIWVNETVDSNVSLSVVEDQEGFLLGYGLFNPISVLLALIGVSTLKRSDLSGRDDDLA